MANDVSLDGRVLAGVSNTAEGEVDAETQFEFEQHGDRIRARYSGGVIVDGFLVGTLQSDVWDIRYVQLTEDGETASGHSIGSISVLDDGRVRVEDEWEWESKNGSGESVLEEIERG